MKKRAKNCKKGKNEIVYNTEDVHYKEKDNTIGYAVSGVLVCGLGIYQYINGNSAAGILLGVIGLIFVGMSIFENKRTKKLGIKK